MLRALLSPIGQPFCRAAGHPQCLSTLLKVRFLPGRYSMNPCGLRPSQRADGTVGCSGSSEFNPRSFARSRSQVPISKRSLFKAQRRHDGDGQLLRLGLQAYALGIVYEFDPYFGLSISRVDPLPHQLEAVYDYLLKTARVPGRRSWPGSSFASLSCAVSPKRGPRLGWQTRPLRG
jgi:hypothetical protein